MLSAPFPITKLSYRRKFIRDITGQTGYQQRKAQLLNALGPKDWPLRQRAAHFWEKLGPQCLVNAVMFAALAAAGVWWAYPLLWLVPLLTWMMVITRIRNIAEHAVVARQQRSLAQYPHHAREFSRAAVHRAVLRELSPRASSLVLRALLQSAEGASHAAARAGTPIAWRCSRVTPRCCGSRPRSRTGMTGPGNS